MLGTKAFSCANSVHSNVAPAKYHHVFTVLGGRVYNGEVVGTHKVCASKVLICKKDVGQVFARNIQKLGKAGAGCHVERVEALLAQKLLGVGKAPHNGVVLKVHAKRL